MSNKSKPAVKHDFLRRSSANSLNRSFQLNKKPSERNLNESRSNNTGFGMSKMKDLKDVRNKYN